MVYDHLANTNNGNMLYKISTAGALVGRKALVGLAIRTVPLTALRRDIGDIVATVIKSINPDNDKDLAKGYRQPTNHDDRDENLPVAPGNGVEYREYFVPGNGLPKAAFARLVADLHNRRMFITPTHYDIWIPDRDKSKKLPDATALAHGDAGACSPFFLIDTTA